MSLFYFIINFFGLSTHFVWSHILNFRRNGTSLSLIVMSWKWISQERSLFLSEHVFKSHKIKTEKISITLVATVCLLCSDPSTALQCVFFFPGEQICFVEKYMQKMKICHSHLVTRKSFLVSVQILRSRVLSLKITYTQFHNIIKAVS